MNSDGGASKTTEPAHGSSGATDVSLREYLSDRIDDGQRLMVERLGFLAALGGVVWFFIERHLADLNHENARVAKVSESSVSSDTYRANEEQRKKEAAELGEWRKGIDRAGTQSISRDEFQRDTKTDRRGSLDSTTKILGAVFASILVALALLNYQALHSRPTVPVTTVTVTTPTVP